MPWGPRARPSAGGSQAGGHVRSEERGGRDDQDSAQRAVAGRGQADMATLGGVRPGGFGVRREAGETPVRGSAKVSPQGEERTRAGHPRRAQGAPHHRGLGAHGSDGSGLAAAGREVPNAGSVVPAPSPQSLQLRAPSLREHGSPPKAQAPLGAAGHSR